MGIERQDYIKKDILDPFEDVKNATNEIIGKLKSGKGSEAVEQIKSTQALIDELTIKIDNIEVTNFSGEEREKIIQAKETFSSIRTNFLKVKKILKSFEEGSKELNINKDIDDIKEEKIEFALKTLKEDWRHAMGVSSSITFEDFEKNSTLEEKKNLIKRYYEKNKNNPAKQNIILEIKEMEEILSA